MTGSLKLICVHAIQTPLSKFQPLQMKAIGALAFGM